MDLRRWVTTCAPGGVPAVVALVALPLRDGLPSADVAAVLVAAVAVAGTFGAAASPLVAGVAAGLAYSVLWAEPFGSIEVEGGADRLSVVVIVVVGGALGVFCRRLRAAPGSSAEVRPLRPIVEPRRSTTEHLQTVGRVAGGIADGDMAGLVVLDVARSMVDVLRLRDCEFEVPPLAAPGKPCLRRDGWLERRGHDWDPTAIGLPESGFYVPVVARGQVAGRFLCTPRSRHRPSRERVEVALTLADQVASALLLEAVA